MAIVSHSPGHAADTGLERLKQLSLDDLLELEVSTVSRREEPWWTAASGVDIVTGEDIRRSGALNLPDALRLATGVHVGQSSARSWGVSLRGMNVLAANKISVAMDGRSLFTPFFSGVQWDAQDTLLEDIDRIEVVRGPVGASWGAFAVNGFIQILTKPAWDTQGWLASAGAGTEDPLFVSFRYGGKLAPETYYRVYAKYYETDWTYDAAGQHALPSTEFFQTGFRLDARRDAHTTYTLQGDYYTNHDLVRDRSQTDIDGANLLGRWHRDLMSEAQLELEGYLDHTYRLIPAQFEEVRNTASLAVKYQRKIARHNLLARVDGLWSRDHIGNMGFAVLEPARRSTHTAGASLQDTWQLADPWALTLATRLEHNSFSGFEYQPTARLAWTPSARTTVWAAISRAVRTPVRIDEDLAIRFSGTTLFEANDDFKTEVARVYEVGWRRRPREDLTFDISAFTYRYDNLRSTEPLGAAVLPRTFANMFNAKSSGVEATILYQPIPPLLFKGSYRYLDLEFTRDAGSIDTTGGSSEGDDPKHLATIGAHLDLPRGWEFDAYLRHASDLPNPALPGYTVFDLRIGWKPSPRCEISLTGRNLGERQYPEFITTNSLNEQVHRKATLKVTWRY